MLLLLLLLVGAHSMSILLGLCVALLCRDIANPAPLGFLAFALATALYMQVILLCCCCTAVLYLSCMPTCRGVRSKCHTRLPQRQPRTPICGF